MATLWHSNNNLHSYIMIQREPGSAMCLSAHVRTQQCKWIPNGETVQWPRTIMAAAYVKVHVDSIMNCQLLLCKSILFI